VLRNIHQHLPEGGFVAACIPNAQHWSLQVQLATGNFRYQDSGLLDRTHLRWFTRTTAIELFQDTGYKITAGFPRIFQEPHREKFLPYIGMLAESAGYLAKQAIEDALPLQYVILAEKQ